jgi:hypothetical protein
VRAAVRPWRRRALALLASLLAGALLASGCAGARVQVTADRAHYPLSLSSVVRDGNGRIYGARSLVKVGWLDVRKTTPGLAYSALTIPATRDFSDEINAQIAAAGGEAVVGLALSVRGSCGWLNGFPILNALPFWPGCVPVRLTGDIVKRRSITP